jgi:hypothetical protein
MESWLVDTQIEDRDGAAWVTGACAACGAHLAIAADAQGIFPPMRCGDCGSMVEVQRANSKGAQPDDESLSPRP